MNNENQQKPLVETPPFMQQDKQIAYTHQQTLSYTQPVHKSLKRFIMIVFMSVFTFGVVGGYFILQAPKTYAREYLEAVGSDIRVLQEEMQYYLGGFDELADSVNESRESFYEISETKDYDSAKTDTDEDIASINESLELISQTRATKNNYQDLPPDEFDELNQAIDGYLDLSEEAMGILLEHQELQKTMLQASGDELNEQLILLQTRVTVGSIKLPDDLPFYLNLTVVAKQSVERYDNISEVPKTEQAIYDLKIEYHQVLLRTLEKIYDDLSQPTGADAQTIASHFIELNSYVQSKNEQIAVGARAYVDNSEIVQLLLGADSHLDIIASEVDTLKAKYGANVVLVEQG